jgi:hypothetical protein
MYTEILTRKATISFCCMTSYTCKFNTCRNATIKVSQTLCKRVKQVCSDALHLWCQMNTLCTKDKMQNPGLHNLIMAAETVTVTLDTLQVPKGDTTHALTQ